MDAFYASVEQLDHPENRGRPVVVGGSPEGRGVVAAASYEARAFGVRSAMPMSRALRLCPEAVRVSPRFERYGEMSARIMAIFRALTPLVEPLSLDEAFLDVTGWVADGAEPGAIGRSLKDEVRGQTWLTLSVGIGSSKSVAKIASDLRKPDGLVVIPPGSEAEFLAPLPIRLLWGVGPKTERALKLSGVRTIGDLARRSAADAERLLGSSGTFLQQMARGVDERGVETERERKSVGAETTFAEDLSDGPELRAALHRIAVEVSQRLMHSGVRAHTVALKLRYGHFKTITRQSSGKTPIDDEASIASIAIALFDATVTDGDRFRLVGIQCSKLVEQAPQGELWNEGPVDRA